MKNWTIIYKEEPATLQGQGDTPLTFLLRDFFRTNGLKPISREWMFDIMVYSRITVDKVGIKSAVCVNRKNNIITIIEEG